VSCYQQLFYQIEGGIQAHECTQTPYFAQFALIGKSTFISTGLCKTLSKQG